MVGENCGAERCRSDYRDGHCRGIFFDISVAGLARRQRSAFADSGAAGGVGGDDSFSCSASCVELAVYSGVVLGTRVFAEDERRLSPRSFRDVFHRRSAQSPTVAVAAVDAALGELARWIPGWLRASGDLLGRRGVAVGETEG